MKEFTKEQQQVCQMTCPECPLRRAQQKTASKALPLLKLMHDEGIGMSMLEQTARPTDEQRKIGPPWPSNALEKCARQILEGQCELFENDGIQTYIYPPVPQYEDRSLFEMTLEQEMRASGL